MFEQLCGHNTPFSPSAFDTSLFDENRHRADDTICQLPSLVTFTFAFTQRLIPKSLGFRRVFTT